MASAGGAGTFVDGFEAGVDFGVLAGVAVRPDCAMTRTDVGSAASVNASTKGTAGARTICEPVYQGWAPWRASGHCA